MAYICLAVSCTHRLDVLTVNMSWYVRLKPARAWSLHLKGNARLGQWNNNKTIYPIYLHIIYCIFTKPVVLASISDPQSGLPLFDSWWGFELCHWPSSGQIEPPNYPALKGVTNLVHFHGPVWLYWSLKIHVPIFPPVFIFLARPSFFFTYWLLPSGQKPHLFTQFCAIITLNSFRPLSCITRSLFWT